MSSPPSIDIVIIGLNSAKTLGPCIESVRSSRYPQSRISIFYVDGGSSDESLKIAESLGCTCLGIDSPTPTPGRQRNVGWKYGSAEYIQFLDSDTIMDSDWLKKAVSTLIAENLGAIWGDRNEMYPDKTVFNWLGNLEWNPPPGETETFGGDVFISRAALMITDGYNPNLIAGEDPELAYRINRAGFKIVKVAEPMTEHDLAMSTLRQYRKRAYRSGHAYAEVHALHNDLWGAETRRINIRTLPFLVGLASLSLIPLSPWVCVAPILGTAILLRPRILLVGEFQSSLSLTRQEARTYAWHASLVVIPQFFGMLRFLFGRLFSRPLTNQRLLPVVPGKGGAR